jgi:cytochrome c oxidase subunit III
MHLIYIVGGALEFFIMLVWLLIHDIDDKHALDVTLAGGYWYWVAGMWLPIYATIYFAPRFL